MDQVVSKCSCAPDASAAAHLTWHHAPRLAFACPTTKLRTSIASFNVLTSKVPARDPAPPGSVAAVGGGPGGSARPLLRLRLLQLGLVVLLLHLDLGPGHASSR